MRFPILALLFPFAAMASFAGECPRLEGRYRCPPLGSQPELLFTLVRTEEADGVNAYEFRYDEYPPATSRASPNGTLNGEGTDASWVYCMDDKLVYFKVDSSKGWIQESFRGEGGDFVVHVRGREVIRCETVPESRR